MLALYFIIFFMFKHKTIIIIIIIIYYYIFHKKWCDLYLSDLYTLIELVFYHNWAVFWTYRYKGKSMSKFLKFLKNVYRSKK